MDVDPLSTMLLNVATTFNEPISGFKIFATIFLVLLNGFFVAAEFAIVKVRVSQLEVKRGVSASMLNVAKSIVNHLDGYLAATQLGITLASLGLGYVGEEIMTRLVAEFYFVIQGGKEGMTELQLTELYNTIKPFAIGLGFAIITVMHIVLGELAPKSIAIRYPTNTTIAISWPLKIFYFIFRPAIFILNGFANFLLRIIGIKPVNHSEIHSEEELKMIISESQQGGAIEETERELIQNVFEFDDRRVMNIYTMRKNVASIDASATVNEVTGYAIKEGYSRYPVYEGSSDNIIGILHTKDLMKEILDNNNMSVNSLIRPAHFISENSKIKNVLKDFQKKHIQIAIVTNEIGEYSGIVTMEDILEELVGEIQDEHDNEQPIVVQLNDNTFLVSAHSNITDINKYLPYKLDEGEHYDTLSGLISDQVEGLELKVGEEICIGAYKATIVKMYRNSVEKIELYIEDESKKVD